MKLTKVDITNFRCFESLAVPLQPDVNGRRPAACADCARLARLGEPPVAPADVLA
jgi:hypothetical protein